MARFHFREARRKSKEIAMQKKLPTGKNANDDGLPKRVGIIYSDVKKECFATEVQYITEKDADKDAMLIGEYLMRLGINVSLYPGNENLPFLLNLDRPEMVINLVDSVQGDETLASTIPGVLGLLNIPFTGADVLGLALDTNKFLVKKLLRQNGIPVPNFQLIHSPEDDIDETLHFPLISKLNAIHGAVEITRDAVSENGKHLRDRLRFLIQTYHQPVLIEEFITGREITAILLEGMNRNVYMAERVFLHGEGNYIFTTFENQWLSRGDTVFRYQKFHDETLAEYIQQAFDITRMLDYGKFDVRLDSSGQCFFIDTNCNPAFGPKELDVALSVILDLYGISFEEILKRLLLNTVRNAPQKERIPIPVDMGTMMAVWSRNGKILGKN
jgi:D-alanine-D-alanine ligase